MSFVFNIYVYSIFCYSVVLCLSTNAPTSLDFAWHPPTQRLESIWVVCASLLGVFVHALPPLGVGDDQKGVEALNTKTVVGDITKLIGVNKLGKAGSIIHSFKEFS
jgi:hypothetical protein